MSGEGVVYESCWVAKVRENQGGDNRHNLHNTRQESKAKSGMGNWNMDFFSKVGSLALLSFLLIACVEQSGSHDEVDQISDSVVESTPALHSIDSSAEEPADTDQHVVQPETNLEAANKPESRVQFGGITFLYPIDLIDDVVAEQLSPANDITSEGSQANSIPQPIQFTFITSTADQTVPTELWVEAIREKNGSYYASLAVDQRLQFEELEKRLQRRVSVSIDPSSGESEQVITFVNGSGIRSIVDENNQESYHFQGLTNDGRYMVTFISALTAFAASDQFVPSVSELDGIIETLFIDGAAEALNVSNCVDDAEFVDNVTIPDGTEIAPGETFVKTWRMRNSGTCTWTNNYSWTFRGGDVLTLLDTTTLDLVSPGQELDISVTLVAPESPGSYAGQWQLSGVDQFEGIGPEVYYLISVSDS